MLIRTLKLSFIFPIMLFAIALPARAGIVLESSKFLNHQNNSGATFDIVDESGSNSSSILLVGIGQRRRSVVPTSEITLSWSGGSDQTGTILTSDVLVDVTNSIFAFDLGNVAGPEQITINNLDSDGFRETFSIIQVSGATLDGVIVSSAKGTGGSDNSITTGLTGVTAGAFVFGIGINRSNNPSFDRTIGPSDASGYSENGSPQGSFYTYDLGSAGGDVTVGYQLTSDPERMVMSAVALGVAQTVPEPNSLLLAIGFSSLSIISRRRRRPVN